MEAFSHRHDQLLFPLLLLPFLEDGGGAKNLKLLVMVGFPHYQPPTSRHSEAHSESPQKKKKKDVSSAFITEEFTRAFEALCQEWGQRQI